eukprot:TRINITY_DN8932_c0_g1_i1.p1 TRINITY_DN8932_c0_g1~~TRINITY_DN8932_c0_g1_i1.p1  ORF type:complete len:274 (+),score=50.98 TRINITY_DN8932_c0_g1_i1:108-929(+)
MVEAHSGAGAEGQQGYVVGHVTLRERVNQIYSTEHIRQFYGYIFALALLLLIWTVATWGVKSEWITFADTLLTIIFVAEIVLRGYAAGDACCSPWYICDAVVAVVCVSVMAASWFSSSRDDDRLQVVVLFARYATQAVRLVALWVHYHSQPAPADLVIERDDAHSAASVSPARRGYAVESTPQVSGGVNLSDGTPVSLGENIPIRMLADCNRPDSFRAFGEYGSFVEPALVSFTAGARDPVQLPSGPEFGELVASSGAAGGMGAPSQASSPGV